MNIESFTKKINKCTVLFERHSGRTACLKHAVHLFATRSCFWLAMLQTSFLIPSKVQNNRLAALTPLVGDAASG
jgi:hypothetical protein